MIRFNTRPWIYHVHIILELAIKLKRKWAMQVSGFIKLCTERVCPCRRWHQQKKIANKKNSIQRFFHCSNFLPSHYSDTGVTIQRIQRHRLQKWLRPLLTVSPKPLLHLFSIKKHKINRQFRTDYDEVRIGTQSLCHLERLLGALQAAMQYMVGVQFYRKCPKREFLLQVPNTHLLQNQPRNHGII